MKQNCCENVLLRLKNISELNDEHCYVDSVCGGITCNHFRGYSIVILCVCSLDVIVEYLWG